MTISARVLTPSQCWFEDLHVVTKQDGKVVVQEGKSATRQRQLNGGRNV
jgi:hypothetical protein